MTLPSSALGMARFGPYELDLRLGEVRKFGTRLKLGEQPLRILIFLIERQGELVTREELRTSLWSTDTFVDFDHSLNSAVQRLRDRLSDTADNAKWIETIPRRGYRFVGEIEWMKPNGVKPEAASRPYALASSPQSDPAPSIRPNSIPDATQAVPASHPRLSIAAGFWSIVLAGVLVLCAAAYLYVGRNRTQPGLGPAEGHVMLAVLPFENLSNDSAEDYFSDGLTEEMISQIGQLSPDQLGVIARTTSMAYKHTKKSVQQIGHELGVDYVLESSVRRDGDRVRITTQLIRTRDQIHVWAESYDRQIGYSIALQEEVAREVAQQIQVKLGPAYASRPPRSHSESMANEAYLRGRYFQNQFTPDGYRRAITYFQQVIDHDPTFAEAHAGLSDSYRFLVVTDTISPAEGAQKLSNSAHQAVLLGDSLAESHSAMAGAMMDRWDWLSAEKEFKRAIALNPSYSNMHRIYAALLASERRHQEAWDQINEAMRTDPLSLPNNAEMVRTLYYARDYDGALGQAQKAMQLDADYYRTHFWLARVYAQKQMYKEAVAESEIVLKATPDSSLALTEMAYSLAAAGRQFEARKILRRLDDRAKASFVPAYNLAVVHIALHENDAALKCLQQAYDEHDWAMLALLVEPRLDPVRKDPRFRDLVAKVFPS
jgi:TolB-like protein/DNA-binding winged helix-turn-helix (wHTH) protein/lipopolysaccharide biosynthesis regulator YciM